MKKITMEFTKREFGHIIPVIMVGYQMLVGRSHLGDQAGAVVDKFLLTAGQDTGIRGISYHKETGEMRYSPWYTLRLGDAVHAFAEDQIMELLPIKLAIRDFVTEHGPEGYEMLQMSRFPQHSISPYLKVYIDEIAQHGLTRIGIMR